MMLLRWSFVVVEGKTRKSGEKSVSDRGSLICWPSALNEPRNLTSTNSNTQKQHEKSQQKERSEQR
jgi:hypothetical protein